METEHISPQESKLTREQILLNNPAFQRLCRGFEIYQKILQDPGTPKGIVIDRMHTLQQEVWDYESNINSQEKKWGGLKKHKKRGAEEEKEDPGKLFLEYALGQAEAGTFDKQGFAHKADELYLNSWLLSNWEHKKGLDENTGLIYLNETLAYHQDNPDQISIHIPPTSTKKEKIIPNILQGLKALAQDIRNGDIKAKKIKLKSWLLNKQLEPLVRNLFGDNEGRLEFNTSSNEEPETISTQKLALMYNGQSLDAYLRHGEMPEVREVVLTPDDLSHFDWEEQKGQITQVA